MDGSLSHNVKHIKYVNNNFTIKTDSVHNFYIPFSSAFIQTVTHYNELGQLVQKVEIRNESYTHGEHYSDSTVNLYDGLNRFSESFKYFDNMNIELNINDRSYHKYYFYNDDDAYQYKDSLVFISYYYSTGVTDKTIIDVNHYTFDINGYPNNRLMVRNDVPYEKDDYEYSSDGLLLNHISYKYSESTWIPQIKIIRTYNTSQLLVTQSTYQYIPESDYWRTDRVINNVYDDDLIVTSETYKHIIWEEGFPSSYVDLKTV